MERGGQADIYNEAITKGHRKRIDRTFSTGGSISNTVVSCWGKS
jgi:hypothetical protein